jgi:hypothetical protein
VELARDRGNARSDGTNNQKYDTFAKARAMRLFFFEFMGKPQRSLDRTEVVIWTPRRTTGRPLSFQPMGDLGAVSDDPDEFAIAIDNVVATLLPRAGLPRSGAKADQGQAVLREALRQFVRRRADDYVLVEEMYDAEATSGPLIIPAPWAGPSFSYREPQSAMMNSVVAT